MALPDWLTGGQWQMPALVHKKEFSWPPLTEISPKGLGSEGGKGDYLLFVRLCFRVPYIFSATSGNLFSFSLEAAPPCSLSDAAHPAPLFMSLHGVQQDIFEIEGERR